MTSAPEPSEPDQHDPDPATGGRWSTADFVVGRGTLLVVGPVVVGLLWAFGALPAWGAAGLGGFFCVVALVFLARLRRAGAADAARARARGCWSSGAATRASSPRVPCRRGCPAARGAGVTSAPAPRRRASPASPWSTRRPT